MKQQFEQLGFYHFIETQPTFNERRQSFKLSIYRFKHSIIEGKFLARYALNLGCVDIWERNKELIRKRTDIGDHFTREII